MFYMQSYQASNNKFGRLVQWKNNPSPSERSAGVEFNGSSRANGLSFSHTLSFAGGGLEDPLKMEKRENERKERSRGRGVVHWRKGSAHDECFPSCSSITHPMIHFADTWVIIGVSSSPPGRERKCKKQELRTNSQGPYTVFTAGVVCRSSLPVTKSGSCKVVILRNNYQLNISKSIKMLENMYKYLDIFNVISNKAIQIKI